MTNKENEINKRKTIVHKNKHKTIESVPAVMPTPKLDSAKSLEPYEVEKVKEIEKYDCPESEQDFTKLDSDLLSTDLNLEKGIDFKVNKDLLSEEEVNLEID
ncbi:hypothetical protein SAMN05216249_104134 [Acetitomaculum ruminis DSM 5522]|uniref:Uncharacterized protein n=1 Tax=Acetitomaculum ruminis DSM 5522 TaxID=1120918 RepID=A0A1I0WM70_9FIRM|nr:hypothetical protein [Acetitomaculum ruminis]SFA89260.1 hypothetical protein SAMN05216249_104134 [Acetitomaculum ruminis DSM 5522]